MVLIFANGSIEEGEWLQDCLQQASVVIAADGGYRHLRALGVRPNILVGDLDSVPPDALTELESNGTQILRFAEDKDETDLELALLHAAATIDARICVVGALGGRLDQTLANILLLAHPGLVNRDVRLVSCYQQAWLIRDESRIVGRAGDRLSLIPIGGDARIGATQNLAWELANEELIFGQTRGVSNVMTADWASVSVSEGCVLCVHTDREWNR